MGEIEAYPLMKEPYVEITGSLIYPTSVITH